VPHTIEFGARGERIAAAYLTRAGLRLLRANWRCREGELDTDALVFSEVRTPRGLGYAHRIEAVIPAKLRRLRTLAWGWLAAHDGHVPALCFDVAGVHSPVSGSARVVHLRNAF
jgi:putative endonuclease